MTSPFLQPQKDNEWYINFAYSAAKKQEFVSLLTENNTGDI
jgi:hypothetical protein